MKEIEKLLFAGFTKTQMLQYKNDHSEKKIAFKERKKVIEHIIHSG